MSVRNEVLAVAVAVLAAVGTGGLQAHDCSLHEGGRPCSAPEAVCPDMDVTQTTVQLGGEGSVDTEHECTCSPGSDADGNIVEADLLFRWDRGSATSGELTLVAENVSANFDPKITKIWFNLPDGVDDCTLVSADVDGTDVTDGWSFSAPGIGEGCLGEFDVELGTDRGIHDSIPKGSTGTFVLSCTGTGLDAMDACAFANEGTTTDVGERSSTAAMHFQTTDQTAQLSDKVSTCSEDLFVELESFEAFPDDGHVRLAWRTYLEIDNAGFYVLRRDVVTGETTRVTRGLIPAEGDIYQGGQYEFVDETAVNGVEYEYILVDVEFSGVEAQHRGLFAVPNPRRAPVELLAPAYGSSELRIGSAPTFLWTAPSARGAVLVASSDPTFEDRSRTLVVGTRQEDLVTLTPGQTRRLEQIATKSGGVIYWQVTQPSLSGDAPGSSVFRAAYGVLGPNSIRADARPAKTGQNEIPAASRSWRWGLTRTGR